MTLRTRAALLAASLAVPALGALPVPASAQADAASAQAAATSAPAAGAPAAKPRAVRGKVARPKRSAKPAGEAAAPSPSIVGSGADPSLERRRRAFFARQPDEATSEEASPAAGVTLGGSGGITPGVGFKF